MNIPAGTIVEKCRWDEIGFCQDKAESCYSQKQWTFVSDGEHDHDQCIHARPIIRHYDAQVGAGVVAQTALEVIPVAEVQQAEPIIEEVAAPELAQESVAAEDQPAEAS